MATASKVVFYSASPFGTGDLKDTCNITISNGEATLTASQTSNIGAGDCIDFGESNTKVYICPCRIGFDSGSQEPKIGNKIEDATSGATGIIRAVEVISGTWGGGNAAGYFYFREVTGTFGDNNNINLVKPISSSNIATIDGSIQGNMSNKFVVKDPDGTETADVGSAQTVNYIHHEYASFSAFEAGYTDSNHINNTDLRSSGADIMAHCCLYYDHDDYTEDSTNVTIDGSLTDEEHTVYVYAVQGNQESINDQKHDNKWNNNRWYMEAGSGDLILVMDEAIRLENLQLYNNGGSGNHCINCSTGSTYSHIGYCIIKATLSGGDNNSYGIYSYGSYVFNCIIYDFDNGNKDDNVGIRFNGSGYGYNLTIYNCSIGVEVPGGFGYCKNIIVNDCYKNCWLESGSGAFHSTAEYNIGNKTINELIFGKKHENTKITDGTESGKLVDSNETFPNVVIGNVVENVTDSTYTYVTSIAEAGSGKLGLNDDIFTSGETYNIYMNLFGDVVFNNEAGDDFTLGAGDTLAKSHGTDLRLDPDLPLWDDIGNNDRGSTWDIGASQITVGGPINAYLTLSSISSIALSVISIFNPSSTFSSSAAQSQSGFIITNKDLTLSSIAAQSQFRTITVDRDFILSSIAAQSQFRTISANRDLTLLSGASQAQSRVIEASRSLTLSSIVSQSQSSTLDALASLTLAGNASQIQSSIGNMTTSLNLSAISIQSQFGGIIISGDFTLSAISELIGSAHIFLYGKMFISPEANAVRMPTGYIAPAAAGISKKKVKKNIDLDVIASFTDSAIVAFNRACTLSANAGQVQSRTVDIFRNLNLSVSASQLQAGTLDYSVLLTLSALASQLQTGTVDYPVSFILSSLASQSQTGILIYDGSFILSALASQLQSGIVNYPVNIDLSAIASQLQSVTMNAQTSLILSSSAMQLQIPGMTIHANLNLDANANFLKNYIIEYLRSLNLGSNADISLLSKIIAEKLLNLNSTADLSLISEIPGIIIRLLTDASFDISVIQTISTLLSLDVLSIISFDYEYIGKVKRLWPFRRTVKHDKTLLTKHDKALLNKHDNPFIG